MEKINPTLQFTLEDLEFILTRENSIIAKCDVPLLLGVLCQEAGVETPTWLMKDIAALIVETEDPDDIKNNAQKSENFES